jgi:outer membrane receptor protein involved in Fe transport
LVEFGVEAGRSSGFPGSDTNDNGFGSWSAFAHVGGDAGESHSWRAGASYLSTDARDREAHTGDINEVEAETLFTGDSKVWGLDFVWKWAPDGNPKERNFKFQAEYLKRDEDGELTCLDNSADGGVCTDVADAYSSAQSGWYAQGVYQFMPRWRVGYRYDRLDPGTPDYGANNETIEMTDYHPYRHSVMADYSPSEFSRLRLQYTRDESMQDAGDNLWIVQYIMSLAPRRTQILKRTNMEKVKGKKGKAKGTTSGARCRRFSPCSLRLSPYHGRRGRHWKCWPVNPSGRPWSRSWRETR